MAVVKGLVKTGMTICATVHSPTPATFRLFDAVMILLRGRVVYAGANGMRLPSLLEKPDPTNHKPCATGAPAGARHLPPVRRRHDPAARPRRVRRRQRCGSPPS